MAGRARGRAAAGAATIHVVFTLPAPIADIAYQNKAAIYDLLFKAAAETLLTIAADPKHLGARIGITAVLHTWGSALTHHPHVHMHRAGRRALARRRSAGSPAGRASSCPCACSRALFRRLFLEKLAAAHEAGRLRFFGDSRRRSPSADAFAAYLAPLRKIEWVVYAKRPFAGPEAVLAYLSRYTHRVAISNSRLIAARRQRRHLQVEGLPRQGPRPAEDHDARPATSSSAASSSTSCPAASTASATTACSPMAGAPRTSPAPASCSASRQRRTSPATLTPMPTSRRCACSHARAAAAA